MYWVEGAVCLSLFHLARLFEKSGFDTRLTSYPRVGGGERRLEEKKKRKMKHGNEGI